MDAPAQSAEHLTRRMLRKKLYVLLSTATCAPDRLAPHLAAHLAYMIELEKRGVLFAAGPFTEPDGISRGNGLTIVRAQNADEARRLGETDPFFIAGLRTLEVREWTVMEGSLGVTVNFSDQTISIA
jgi:uncharacterized protein YciI